MFSTFDPFPRLPVELRARIWHIALEDDREVLKGRGRVLEFHSYNTELEEVAVKTSRRYPNLYHICREARYEVATIDGAEWVTVRMP